MATTPLEIAYRPGKTLTCTLYPKGSDTAAASSKTLTEETNNKGTYLASITETISGIHTINVYEGTNLKAKLEADLTDTTETAYAKEIGIAELQSAISGLNDLSASEVNAEVDTALSDIRLDHLLSTSVTGSDVANNSVFAKLVSKSATADWDSYVNTTDSMQAIRDNQTASATSALTSYGVATEAKQDVAAIAGNNTYVEVTGIASVVLVIKGYLDDGGSIDLLIDAIKAKTDNLAFTDTNKVKADTVMINGSSTAARKNQRLSDAALELTVDDATFTPTTTTFETDGTITADSTLIGMAGTWYNSGGTPANDVTYFITASEGTVTNANGKLKITVETLPAAPADGDVFVVLGGKVK